MSSKLWILSEKSKNFDKKSEPNQSKLNQSEPNQSEPNQSKPNQSKPIRGSQIRASQIRASQIRASQIRATEISSNHRELHGAIFSPGHCTCNKPVYNMFLAKFCITDGGQTVFVQQEKKDALYICVFWRKITRGKPIRKIQETNSSASFKHRETTFPHFFVCSLRRAILQRWLFECWSIGQNITELWQFSPLSMATLLAKIVSGAIMRRVGYGRCHVLFRCLCCKATGRTPWLD